MSWLWHCIALVTWKPEEGCDTPSILQLAQNQNLPFFLKGGVNFRSSVPSPLICLVHWPTSLTLLALILPVCTSVSLVSPWKPACPPLPVKTSGPTSPVLIRSAGRQGSPGLLSTREQLYFLS